jgi:hypothetical protein
MADLSDRIPGRTVLEWVAQPLDTPSLCEACGHEPGIAHWTRLLPPEMPTVPDAASSDAMYEQWLAEQQAHIARLTEFATIGMHCLARMAAQFMLGLATVEEFLVAFQRQPMTYQLVGAMAVEPGIAGLNHPMVLGIPGTRSIRELIVLLNAPPGSLNASDDVIPTG